MSAPDRLPVFATRGNLNMARTKLNGARRSHKILKQKADGITVRFRAISRQLVATKDKIREAMRNAYHLQAESKFLMGNYNSHILENITKNSASLKLKLEEEHVVGVRIVHYVFEEVGPDNYPLTGLGTGYGKIHETKEAFRLAAKLMVLASSLENCFVQFDAALEDTNRRLNATGQVIIPRLENTAMWIENEMCELEREDFYRMKKIKNKKIAVAEERSHSGCFTMDDESWTDSNDDDLSFRLKYGDGDDHRTDHHGDNPTDKKGKHILPINDKEKSSDFGKTGTKEATIKKWITKGPNLFFSGGLDFEKSATIVANNVVETLFTNPKKSSQDSEDSSMGTALSQIAEGGEEDDEDGNSEERAGVSQVNLGNLPRRISSVYKRDADERVTIDSDSSDEGASGTTSQHTDEPKPSMSNRICTALARDLVNGSLHKIELVKKKTRQNLTKGK